MSKIRLVLACNNMEFCSLVGEYISMIDDIELVGIANDGIFVLELVRRKQPDVLVLDYVLPYLDGLGVLSVLSGLQNVTVLKMPRIITITTSLVEDFMIDAYRLGADYQIFRRIDIKEIIKCVRMIMEKIASRNKHEIKTKMLNVVERQSVKLNA